MSATLVNQVLLPIGLALMMLAMGLSLQAQHFNNILRAPKALFLGLGLQLFLLPGLAWLIIGLLQLPTEAAAALILISLAPGGATSNAISFLSKGDVALSISMTALSSLIVPFSLPILLALHYQGLGLGTESFHIPILPTIMQLSLVTLLPILVGMGFRHLAPSSSQRIQPHLQKITGLIFIALVCAMAWFNRDQLAGLAQTTGLALLLLAGFGLLLGYFVPAVIHASKRQRRTIAIEVGIQNAGTAMMVAATLMGQPALALIALFYGILMNLPALLFIAWIRRAKQSAR